MASFIRDMEQIRQSAIRKLENGAVTQSYQRDRQQSVAILNEALASEIVCVLRYQHHYFMASGVHGRSVAQTFKKHSDEEREHMDEIAERIQELGGKPDFNPSGLASRSASEYGKADNLVEMIKENLIAERIAVEHYRELIRYFGDRDPTTRHMLVGILAVEEEHANDMHDLLVAHEGRPMLKK